MDTETMQNNVEVRYERLRPAQIVARREACPVAYLPIGTIEWHGEHNPVGLDTLKMHALLVHVRARDRRAGLPARSTMASSASRRLMEANAADRALIARKDGAARQQFRRRANVPLAGRAEHQLSPPAAAHLARDQEPGVQGAGRRRGALSSARPCPRGRGDLSPDAEAPDDDHLGHVRLRAGARASSSPAATTPASGRRRCSCTWTRGCRTSPCCPRTPASAHRGEQQRRTAGQRRVRPAGG